MRILITGCAGFIGFHVAKKFLDKKYKVYGLDNINNYYSISLKKNRLKLLKKNKNFLFKKIDISNREKIKNIFRENKFDAVIHLAAQAGVRYSLKKPYDYYDSNLIGFSNILEETKNAKIKNFLFASSSSVYGESNTPPFHEKKSNTDNPLQIYAATKKSNEILAKAYFNLYKFKIIGLRFFTVYGNYGRPDMAIFDFVKNILQKKIIYINNYGNHYRDFTHINYVAEIIFSLVVKVTKSKKAFFKIFNIGSSSPIKIMKIVKLIQKILGVKAKIKFRKKQKGDVHGTFSNSKSIKAFTKIKNNVSIKEGLTEFINWYKYYFNVK
jgi:UDP-glucuronate 4-epimerase|tara:strand:- start:6943 stop:7917 length:975 start_codon:yes stop_codon:yes gene_type:complete